MTGSRGQHRVAFQDSVRLLRCLRPYWRRLASGMGSAMVISLLGLLPPLLTKYLIDDAYPGKNLSLMHAAVIGICVISVATTVCAAGRSFYMQTVGAHANAAMSLMFFNHVQHLPVSFFDTHSTGDVTSRWGDLRTALSGLTSACQTLIISATYLIVVPPLLLYLNWHLAVMALITTPLVAVVSVGASGIARRRWKAAAESAAAVSAFQIETLSHARTLKSESAEGWVFHRSARLQEVSTRAQLDGAATSAVIGVLTAVIRALGSAIYAWYAWTLIITDHLTLGEFMAFSAYLGYLTQPVTDIATLFGSLQKTSVSLRRAFEILEARPEADPCVVYKRQDRPIRRLRGDIRLADVSFQYAPGVPVLSDVTITMPAGSITAIVGVSGSGKSTMLRLISRLVEPTHGTVWYDGTPSSALSLADVRQQIAVVWQEVGLLRGTLRESLTLGIDHPTEHAIDEALDRCCLTELVAGLPKGLESPIAECGATLSGGQRQRLAIARALLRRSSILLLDEATANIDAETEGRILQSLLTGSRTTTVIYVTHRVATAKYADQVCLVSAGRLAAVDTHEALLARNGDYQRFVGEPCREVMRREFRPSDVSRAPVELTASTR